ncbi:MAG: hypothetical protein KKE44_00400 [Proteobacteria bacterium]|nr:hypothetical protein [Pseudomonadota bacterium]MBU1581187.1 hypothetical protein [Pseudomonadota bacterium]MBU2628091.1 hypothetical protein [Pseudomonadota bacterium]
MSDPTLEEDSLISQDDIDKLLDSSSIEEAEESILGGDTIAANDDDDDELGELSQDDIDSLMNSNVSGSGESADEDDLEDDDMELISQDDIDQLMNSSVAPDEGAAESLEDENDSSDEDFGELSQDDINSLMDSTASPKEELSLSEKDMDDNVDEDDELISQDDINNLMDGKAFDTKIETMDKQEPEEAPVEEELAAPTQESVIVEKPVQLAAQDNSQVYDDVIEESEAVAVQDSLVSQETIDDLINNFDNEAPIDTVILDESPVPEPEPAPVAQVQPEPEPIAELNEPDVQEDSALDGTDDFLTPGSDVTVLDFDDDEDEDVSQEDIDALLLEPDDEEGEEEDILISQDDIDTLLMAADQEDEDVLGDIMDNDFDSSMDDETEDEDILESDSFDENEETDDEDQVVLEDDDEEIAEKPKKKKKKAMSHWYKSKLVIACASALIVLGITVPLTYFLFFSKGPGKEIVAEPVAKLTKGTQREIEIETVDIRIKTQPENKNPGNMILKDFVILASDLSKGMAYITADISIDYSDQKAYHEIQNNLSFYRDLIYDSLNKSLVSEKREEITEADMLWIVETALKKVLPGQYIDRVSFKSFKAS